ncbi:hypothetical protein CVT26_015416 [Gymnopilus dilepis]|uniref:Uncharacterized protein n=1 Tax=Gymnopilus dilepis TaxID=231916 RepID=A0A409YEE1_9AGAR|nr:hypothetical protein CVT26_015416 [Gymnopilus dilepis]
MSPHATSPEQYSEIKKQIEATRKKPLRCYNAHTKKNTRAVIRASGLPADNPQQSEEASHIGGNGNCKRRGCRVDVGVKRSADEVRAEVDKQIKLAMYGVEKPILDRQTSTGTAREMKSADPSKLEEDVAKELGEWLEKQPGGKMHPLLSLAGLDPTQDTPVEILHTILLSIVKHAWHNLHSNWSEAQQNLFTIPWQSTDISGLSVPPLRAAYMQYRNALIGKHLKTLMQTVPFHVHGTSDLDILIGNVLDAFAEVEPSKIIVRMRLHVLLHLIKDVKRYGLAIRNSTGNF